MTITSVLVSFIILLHAVLANAQPLYLPVAPKPSAPAPKPTAPAHKPSAPAPKPTAPAPKPSGPVPKPTAPAPKPSAPVPKPTAPAPKPSAPVPEPTAPAPKGRSERAKIRRRSRRPGRFPSPPSARRSANNVGSQVLVDRRADVGVAGWAQIFDPTE